LDKEINVTKKENNIEVSFQVLESEENEIKKELKITYTIYLYNKALDIDNAFPGYLENNYINKTTIVKTGDETGKINIDFSLADNKEYTIVVLVTVENGDYIEHFSYQAKSSTSDNGGKTEENKANTEKKNELQFYIIMGSFAFIIILVFIIIFCILNKRKADNPDIDDEEFSNLQVLRETINEDEC